MYLFGVLQRVTSLNHAFNRDEWRVISGDFWHLLRCDSPFTTFHRPFLWHYHCRKVLCSCNVITSVAILPFSKAYNERGVMWSRDSQHHQPCNLCEFNLPPHRGQVHWLGEWEVDFSSLSDYPLHQTALLRTSRDEDCNSRESISNSPLESPRRGLSVDSSVGSMEVVITVTQPQIITTTIGTSTSVVSASSGPPTPSFSVDFKEGVTYEGSEEGFIYYKPPSCDKKGWLYTSFR